MKREIIRITEVDSTSNFIKRLSNYPDCDMLIVTADYQTAGRGQGSNRWESEDGKNLLFSILVHPNSVPVTSQFVLSMAGALAVKEVLSTYVTNITAKWPNDIYWNDCKISGTLIEITVCGKTIKECIFGVGINVNQRCFSSDIPNPTSLSNILGKDIDRDELLSKTIDAFEKYYSMVLRSNFEEISSMYEKALYRREGIYGFSDSTGYFEASISHVDESGSLHLVDSNNGHRSYAFKEVSFII